MPEAERTGPRGERLAAEFLEAKGYTILDRNYRFEREEVDLVCFAPADRPGDGGWIVFVEVKTRRGLGFGRPEEAVDEAKQRAILRVAEAYLHERRLVAALCRFDVVAVLLGDGEPEIEHFENAFGYFL
ncbi:MAG: YraN family protein [Rubricoccaceae bacterium]|nr:YraN family protein [Rubricoccaceae bacterium]